MGHYAAECHTRFARAAPQQTERQKAPVVRAEMPKGRGWEKPAEKQKENPTESRAPGAPSIPALATNTPEELQLWAMTLAGMAQILRVEKKAFDDLCEDLSKANVHKRCCVICGDFVLAIKLNDHRLQHVEDVRRKFAKKEAEERTKLEQRLLQDAHSGEVFTNPPTNGGQQARSERAHRGQTYRNTPQE